MAGKWQDLSPRVRKLIVAGGAVELSLKVAALADIWRRPASQIRGPKVAWAAAQAVNGLGPVGYFLFGRRKRAC
jgi:type II secretory pathway component PulM